MALAVSLPAAAAVDPLMIFDTGNVLVGANFNDGLGSSNITLILRLQSSGGIHVDEGDVVSYLVDTAPADGWTQIAFDESGWEAGVSGVVSEMVTTTRMWDRASSSGSYRARGGRDHHHP